MDKPFNHLIICLTFVMPVAALSGCSGPNDSPEQDAVMSISSCTARGDDGQEMSVSEFGMFVTDTAGNLYPDNIRVLNRSGKWTFAEISLSDGDKGIYAYYPYNPSFSGGKMGLDARSQTDYLYSERTMVSGNAPCLSATNAENQQIAKQTPSFTPKNVKSGVFVLFKIIQPLHNKRVAILKESDEKRLIFIYPFSLIFQDFTSS